MARKFQIRRGPLARIPTLAQAEFGMTTDSNAEKLFLGNGASNLEIPFLRDLTPAKLGAIASKLPTADDANVPLTTGGDKVLFHIYGSTTTNSPYSEGATPFSVGLIITVAHTSNYGSQISIPAGGFDIFTRAINELEGIGKWTKYATLDAVQQLLGVAPASME